jgi:small-conductance mechanosensitive channel
MNTSPYANWLNSLNNYIPPFFYVPILFIVWALCLLALKGILFNRLKKWAAKTSVSWDDIVLDSLAVPLNLLILASGLAIVTYLLPMPAKVDRFADVAMQGTIIFAIVFFLDKTIRGFMARHSNKSFGAVSHGVTKGLIRGFIIGLGALIFLDQIGISITPILASLGIGSLAVALALQDTLSNFFAGLYVSIDKPIEVGDFIKLESGQQGYVTDIGWRSTRIRELSNNVIIQPNSKLMGSTITNYYLPDKEVAVIVEMSVHYNSDLNLVDKVTSDAGKEIMQKVKGAIPTFQPFIRYHTFGDSGIHFSVILRAKEFTENYEIKHEFIKLVTERYRQHGIQIPYPTRTLAFSTEAAKEIKTLANSPRTQ